jgi:hypothetical protein
MIVRKKANFADLSVDDGEDQNLLPFERSPVPLSVVRV